MKITLLITFLDGSTKEIECIAADLVAFEDKYNLSITNLDKPRIGWLLYLAWHALKRTKATDKGYEDWLETVDTVGANDDPKAK